MGSTAVSCCHDGSSGARVDINSMTKEIKVMKAWTSASKSAKSNNS